MLVHNPPYREWLCTFTIGSTSALDMILRMFAKPGMYILSEEYTFTTFIETAKPMGMYVKGVPVDNEGISPEGLDRVLSTWDSAAHGGAEKPWLLYTVPTGQNPTGSMHSTQRRHELYAVAQKHDLLILEDEPYYFLQMQPYLGPGHEAPPPPSSVDDFLQALAPSYLSLDVDGRVLRLDSFSKVLAPGSRLGWLTGPEKLVQRYQRHSDVSTQGPCGFSQLALFKLLDEHWGHEGYLKWLIYIRLAYSKRRDVLLDACHEFLPQEVCSWRPPAAGMFFWIEVMWRNHPLAQTLSFEDLEEKIWQKGIEKNALLLKGSFFEARRYAPPEVGGGRAKEQSMFFRATYAAAPEGNIREAVRRFGEAVREEFGLELLAGGDERENGGGLAEAKGTAAGADGVVGDTAVNLGSKESGG